MVGAERLLAVHEVGVVTVGVAQRGRGDAPHREPVAARLEEQLRAADALLTNELASLNAMLRTKGVAVVADDGMD